MNARNARQTLTLFCFLLPALAVQAQPGPAPVAVDEARQDTFSASLWVSGTVISRNDARISAETDGRITWVADVGQRIEAGEPVARVDDADLKLELEDNRAQLESLQARQRYLANNVERLERLADSNNAAVNQLDEAHAELDMTAQEIRRAEVAVAQTQRRIEQSRVVAPFDGVVVERLVQAGEFVTRGSEVARLVDTKNREIRAQAPLSVSSYIREGLEVSVQHEGRESLSPVKRVIPVGDERSRMFEVRIAAEAPGWVIGSPVRVALPNSDPRRLVAVPRDALVLRGSEIFVLRVTTENVVEKVSVATGVGLGSLVEVIGDVNGGDRLVTRGAERLQAGQQVVVAGG
ncbi:MAG: efflux RND transporter periplasmic adaptor subunit [Xanthomonadales bacterium]|nr:efflux RND transporter periplasmic adaptor subunit [Gammaproteobacteria bacterium]NNK38279.1 efflux RND transporter periplasmic adaptor subunit [Xanthomonadales bacterium]